jgi:ElaB/YqjD/DUF883 family membrane-anchored ribosome-binding protein
MINRISEEACCESTATAKQLGEQAMEISSDVQREAKKWLSQLERQIVENPTLALAAALGIGLTVGCLLKRR